MCFQPRGFVKASQHEEGMNIVLRAVKKTPLPAAVPYRGCRNHQETRVCPPIKGGLAKKALRAAAEAHRGEVSGRNGGRSPAGDPRTAVVWLRDVPPRRAEPAAFPPGAAPDLAAGGAPCARRCRHFPPGASPPSLPAGGSTRSGPHAAPAEGTAPPGQRWPAWPHRTPTCRAWPGGPACSTPRSRGRGNLVLEL